MPALYNHTTRATGTILTATIYNTDHQNHIDNGIPSMLDDYSANATEMRTTTDPGEDGSESLATSLAGELARIRHMIAEITGNTYWYESPAQSLATIGGDSAFTTGDVKITAKTTADTGWVMMNDGSIGNASSGGTTRANADTSDLFTLLWTNFANTECPTQDSSGSSVARGASAAADYAANRRIVLPKVLGRSLAVAGAGSGLTSRALGVTAGAETHTLTAAESGSPAHGHTGSLSGASAASDGAHGHTLNMSDTPNGSPGILAVAGLDTTNGGTTDASTSSVVSGGAHTHTVTGSVTVNNSSAAAASSAHNNMQPTSFLNVMIKL